MSLTQTITYFPTSSFWTSVGIEDAVLLSLFGAACAYIGLWSQPQATKVQRARLRELSKVPQSVLRHSAASTEPLSRNICEVVSSSAEKPTIVVFWGSQGGTAEAIASRYASELASRLSIPVISADLNDYDHVHIASVSSHTLLVFVLATYGEGDPTDNALAFLSDLRSLESNGQTLQNLRYSVFGLGNTNYRKYNKVAIDVNDILTACGATRIGPLGLGNDCQGATEEDFAAWKSDMNNSIAGELGLESKSSGYVPRFRLTPIDFKTAVAKGLCHGAPSTTTHDSRSRTKPLVLPLDSAHRLTSTDLDRSRQCIHLEFSLRNVPGAHYETGDYLQVWPMNPENEVQLLLESLGISELGGTIFEITTASDVAQGRVPISSPVRLDTMFRHYLDICGPISREFARNMVEFLPSDESVQRLKALVEDREAFRTHVTETRLSLDALLRHVMPEGTVKQSIPLSYISENMKRLQPRSYSISSSSLAEPGRIAITALASTEHVPSPMSQNEFRGVASHYLLQLEQEINSRYAVQSQNVPIYATEGPQGLLRGPKLFAQIRKSEFKLPSEPSAPVIMIGSGTGVAPFRAFVQERIMMHTRGQDVGEMILIAGHRSPTEDFYYEDLWRQASQVLGQKFQLYTAFSRHTSRLYVQDVLATQADRLLPCLSEKSAGTLFVCGSSSMANGVRSGLKEAWLRFGDGEKGQEDAAASWLDNLQRTKRYQEDCWG